MGTEPRLVRLGLDACVVDIKTDPFTSALDFDAESIPPILDVRTGTSQVRMERVLNIE